MCLVALLVMSFLLGGELAALPYGYQFPLYRLVVLCTLGILAFIPVVARRADRSSHP